jgi:hypothetical protein
MLELAKALIVLLVLNLGVVVGAGLYEARVVMPLWGSALPETARSPEAGRRFWLFVATVPLTVLALFNFAMALLEHGPWRLWWLFAALLVIAERVVTFAYFIPEMVRMQRSAPTEPKEIEARFAAWRARNRFRLGILIVAWLAALQSLHMAARTHP